MKVFRQDDLVLEGDEGYVVVHQEDNLVWVKKAGCNRIIPAVLLTLVKPAEPAGALTTEELCEGLVRHLEVSGEEMFEKNFVKDGKILCSVFCIIGDNAEEMTAVVREWANNSGFKRSAEKL